MYKQPDILSSSIVGRNLFSNSSVTPSFSTAVLGCLRYPRSVKAAAEPKIICTAFALAMPDASVVRDGDVELALRLLARQRGLAGRRRALMSAWESRRQTFARACRDLLQELAAQEGQQAAQRDESAAQQDRRALLHRNLASLEAVRAERDEARDAEAAEQAAVQLELDEARRRREDAMRAHQKALIRRRRDLQAATQRQAAQAEAEAAAAGEEERLQQAEHNLARVQHRHQELHLRLRLRQEKDEHERLLEEETRRRLLLVTERVDARLNVQPDAERTRQPTAASAAPVAGSAELFPVHGYTDQAVMRDMRFRISEALTKAGINDTSYARQTVAALSHKPASGHQHQNSSIKLG